MKMNTASGNGTSILFITNKSEDALAARRTLAHVYPEATVTECPDDKVLPEKTDILLIDTDAVSGAKLEHLLDRINETPAILIVSDFAGVRLFGDLLTSRRSIISRADISGMGLISGVHHLLERLKLHEQLQKTSLHLKELSIRDELTKLFNHRHLGDLLATEIKKANRYKRPLSFIIVSLKNFAAINEAAGGNEADRLLLKAAAVVKGAVREVDIPARFGDDEFAIILPESNEQAAMIVARRIQTAFTPITVATKDADLKLSTAIGVAAVSPEVQNKDELLRAALAALIEAKKSNTDAIFTSGDVVAKKPELKENRRLVRELGARIRQLSVDAEHNYFQSVMKLLSEAPQAKKTLMPHSERVAFFAQRLAEGVGMPEADAKSIHRAGFLHDAGKLAIDPAILAKPGRLSNTEEELMKQHPELGIEIIGKSIFFATELNTILYHHERFDGSGYPKGISGNSIPLSARILGIAEAWDTMITPQVYRTEPLPLDAALSELKKGAGTQFDPSLVEKFTSLIAG